MARLRSLETQLAWAAALPLQSWAGTELREGSGGPGFTEHSFFSSPTKSDHAIFFTNKEMKILPYPSPGQLCLPVPQCPNGPGRNGRLCLGRLQLL